MSFEAKQRIVVAVLAVLAAWPPIHHVLVRTTELSPWKGAGWSMYCVPGRSVRIGVNSLDQGEALSLSGSLPAAFQRAHSDFVERRKALGRRAEPDGFARAVFDLFPQVDRIEIIVEQTGVDRASARVVSEGVDRYEYQRGARGAIIQ